MKKQIVLLLLLFVIERQAWSQVAVPFTSDLWKFENQDYQLEEYLGKQSVKLNKNRAALPSVQFENGIIEYDVAFPQARGFIAVSFRAADNLNNEEFYFRPHQSGNPDANQYTPVYSGQAGWQLYYGEGYGAPVRYSFDTWMHTKLVVSGQYMEVYINDMDTPVLFSELKRPVQSGHLALRTSGETHFANFSYSVMEKVTLKGSPKPRPPLAEETIASWEVSNPLAEKDLAQITSLPPALKKNLAWKKETAEHTGTLNLASVAPFSPEKNTVFVKVVITSDKDQVSKLTFGFSDRARVYLNDALLYSGTDEYTSRDYRFLGTIGYFDSVYLHLKKGNNEVLIAVSEDFGGWGVKAKLENIAGISFKTGGK